MRRLALIVFAAAILPGAAAAQTWGQPRYGPGPTTYGQTYGGPVGYGGYRQGHGYSPGYGYPSPAYGDPRAYRHPARYGYRHDRGGRYGYSAPASGQWTRWSSPPGRGYHDVYGYNDDRAPRGADDGRYRQRDCACGVGAYPYDR